MQYRRHYQQGATYFFKIVLQDRSSDLLIAHIDILCQAFQTVKQKHPFHIDAVVILPDKVDYARESGVFGNVDFGNIAFAMMQSIVPMLSIFI